jgi:hypothetical protein
MAALEIPKKKELQEQADEILGLIAFQPLTEAVEVVKEYNKNHESHFSLVYNNQTRTATVMNKGRRFFEITPDGM